MLADEDTWVVLEKPGDLAGLPDSLRAAYKAAADERKLGGKWAVVNTRSSVDPFLTSSSRRDLREKVWKAFKNRGDNGGENDTKATIARIVKLRAERAALLGYPSHAHWRMVEHHGRRSREGRAADDAGVARGGGAGEGGGRRHAEAGGEGGHQADHRALGLPLLRREGAQGAATTSTRTS